jgi:predicted RNA-binding protein YlxR (DUF448 family)
MAYNINKNMLCSIKNKRGSVKYYINLLPTDIIKIIKKNIHFKKTIEYKNNKKVNKKLIKALKDNSINYFIYNHISHDSHGNEISTPQSQYNIFGNMLTKKSELCRLQVLMCSSGSWDCKYRINQKQQLLRIKANHDSDIYKIFMEKARRGEYICKALHLSKVFDDSYIYRYE